MLGSWCLVPRSRGRFAPSIIKAFMVLRAWFFVRGVASLRPLLKSHAQVAGVVSPRKFKSFASHSGPAASGFNNEMETPQHPSGRAALRRGFFCQGLGPGPPPLNSQNLPRIRYHIPANDSLPSVSRKCRDGARRAQKTAKPHFVIVIRVETGPADCVTLNGAGAAPYARRAPPRLFLPGAWPRPVFP